MERTAWTDERIDDLVANFDRSVSLLHEDIGSLREDFRQERELVRSEMGGLRTEMGGLRTEMADLTAHVSTEMSTLRGDLSAWQRQMTQIGWALAGTLTAAVVALVIGTLA